MSENLTSKPLMLFTAEGLVGKVYGYTAQIQAIEVGIKPKEMVDRSCTRNFRALPGIIVASI